MRHNEAYSRKFYLDQRDGSYKSAAAILPLLTDHLSIRSVCDVGCGVGAWLRVFNELGIEGVFSLDGAHVDHRLLQISDTDFRPTDLRERITIDRTFNLAVSMEAAEHLPLERAASFVEDPTKLSSRVLFSAATPMQRGSSHINEQWQSYSADKFSACGYAVSNVIRPLVWKNSDVDHWYWQNALLYRRVEIRRNDPNEGDYASFPVSPRASRAISDPTSRAFHPRGCLWSSAGHLRRQMVNEPQISGNVR